MTTAIEYSFMSERVCTTLAQQKWDLIMYHVRVKPNALTQILGSLAVEDHDADCIGNEAGDRQTEKDKGQCSDLDPLTLEFSGDPDFRLK